MLQRLSYLVIMFCALPTVGFATGLNSLEEEQEISPENLFCFGAKVDLGPPLIGGSSAYACSTDGLPGTQTDVYQTKLRYVSPEFGPIVVKGNVDPGSVPDVGLDELGRPTFVYETGLATVGLRYADGTESDSEDGFIPTLA